MKDILFLSFLLVSYSTLAKQYNYDYDIESWRCGAPLVQELQQNEDSWAFANETGGLFRLKESLRRLCQSNMAETISRVGTLSKKEQELFDLINDWYHAPIVHRTDPTTAQKMLTTNEELASPTKRNGTAFTPTIEQELFAGHDCIFTTIGIPDGTERYGSTILRLKRGFRFGWATLRSGFQWIKNDLNEDPNGSANTYMRRQFSKLVITDEYWDAAIAYMIIENIRGGTTFLNQGKPYNNATMLAHLLSQKNSNSFWEKVQKYRLGYMEGKYIENISVDALDSIKFDSVDEAIVKSWNLRLPYFSPLITFYDNSV